MTKGLCLFLLVVVVFAAGFGAAYYWQSARTSPAATQGVSLTGGSPALEGPMPPPAPAAPPPPSPAPRAPRAATPAKAATPPVPVSEPSIPPAEPASAPKSEPAPPPAVAPGLPRVVIPAGTELIISLLDGLSSEKNQAGDVFQATLDEAVVVNGREVIPRHARVWGEVVDAVPSGRLKQRAELQLRLTAVEIGGKNYELSTSTLAQQEGSKTKRDVIAIGGGAGIGAVIGGAAGGGKGAGIGAAIGAGAGTAAAAATGKRDLRFPPETLLRFRLRQELKVEP